MPEPSDSLHRLYDAEARVEVLPARGINVLTGAARAARRRALLRSGLMGGAVAVVAGALVLTGVHVLGGPSTPAAAPSATLDTHNPTLRVTWNPTTTATQAMDGFSFPACGEVFDPQPVGVDTVRVAAVATLDDSVIISGREDELPIAITTQFTTTDGSTRQLVAAYPGYVVTRDHVVVAVQSHVTDNLDLFTANSSGMAPSHAITPVFGRQSCDAQAAIDALHEQRNWDPDAPHSDADTAAMSALEDQASAPFRTWPSGTYQVYYVTPVIFGDQLAAAERMQMDGAARVGWVRTDLANTPYGQDPRIAPYCLGADADRSCNPPDDVIDDVLTFDVDATTVDGTPPGLAISAPAEVVVP